MFAQGIFRQDPSASPDSLQRRREMLAAMMPRYGSAKYVGEGLGQLFTGIARGAAHRRLDGEENKERDRITDAFGRLFSGGGTAVDGAPILGPTQYTPPDPNSPEGIAGDAMVALGKRSPYADAIAAVESAGSGDYSALGPTTKSGDRAYGRYQVMGSNVGPWTEKYLGKRMTPEEFLASPEAQDAVFNGEFGSYVQKYGNPQDAASMWFSGRPMAEAGNASDGYNTVPQYVDKFTRAMGGPERVTPAGGGMDIATLAEIASSPYADPGQRQVAQILLQQQMQAADPKSALELENMRLQNEALKNPPKKDNRTSDMLEYDRAVLDYIQRGQPVPTFTEWMRGNKASGATTINNTFAPDGQNPAETATPRDPGNLAKKLSEADAKFIEEERELSRAASDMESIATQMETIAPNIGYTGPGGRMYGAVDDLIGILPGDSGARGAFRSLATDAQLTFTAKTKGAITDREMGTFKQAVPGLTQTAEGNLAIAKVLRAGAKRTQARAQFMEQFAAQKGSLEGAQEAWQQFIQANPIISQGESGTLNVAEDGDWRAYLPNASGRIPEQTRGGDEDLFQKYGVTR